MTSDHDANEVNPRGDGDDQFDIDAIDDDGDGTLESTVVSSVEGIDLDGDGLNDVAVLTSETMTDLDGDGLPDVIETTKTMIQDNGDGDIEVVQTTERVFIEHGDLDGEPVLVPDHDELAGSDGHDHPVFRDPAVIRGLHHVSVNVDDLEACERFYIDALGLQRIHRPDIGIGGTWLVAENGIQVHLVEWAGSEGPDSNHMAFVVDDIDRSIADLRAKGIEIGDWSPIAGGKQAFMRDPSGNIVELNQPPR
jgi:catechol 2,3-dioxygenase-like lactoylglutathione lyase family enzyme